MRAKRYRVQLTGEEQEELKGRAAAYRQTHARILVLNDENQASDAMRDEEIARALKVGRRQRWRLVRRRCVDEGLERQPWDARQQMNRCPRKLDDQGEAHLVALACSQPPDGRAGWTLHLLAERLVEREIVESRVTPVSGPGRGD